MSEWKSVQSGEFLFSVNKNHFGRIEKAGNTMSCIGQAS